ncbi:MAG TPA: TIGR01620 family protein [Xanthobacteraceae bacterium]|jgi:putative membrane protein|nr:TIGR01620 family protein [Xanthobacteraceae bacterium]
MSKNWPHRPPAVFRLDDDDVIVGLTKDEPAKRAVQVIPEPDAETSVIAVDDSLPWRRRGLRWGALFWGALGGLILLAAGLAVVRLIEDLFARSQEFGFLGLALAILAAVAFLVVAVRETMGLARLATIEKLNRRAADTLVTDDRQEGLAVGRALLALTRRMPRLARSRAAMESHLGDIIDGADMVRLAERELMTPLDQQARRAVSAAATRVSAFTALSPRAAIDVLFVFGSALILVRRLSLLYGARPGALGLVRLMRLVVLHLAMTGGMATTDGLIQQMLGHGIAGKLSARLGEGLLNGFLTARLGLAAIDVVRPLPFTVLPRPTLRNLMSDVLRGYGEKDETP